MKAVFDIHVRKTEPLPTPLEIRGEIPAADRLTDKVSEWRREIIAILFGEDTRRMIIVGPCSIHDTDAALEYARNLKELSRKVEDRLLLVMRAYFEKPRTAAGWKGLIMDPLLDGSCNIPLGLRKARGFLRDLLEIGLPTATELLDPVTPQYIADLICWSAVGARTSESQVHRQMASGLSMPLGFKNATSGSLDAAINAIKAASQPMTFMGIDVEGRASAIATAGNPFCHVVLRGGDHGPNYSLDDLDDCSRRLKVAGLVDSITVDCSHANSGKDASAQPQVFREVWGHFREGRSSLRAWMLESNLLAGAQGFPAGKETLRRGVSITDACLDWKSTESLIMEAYRTFPGA